jgi:urease accessory protein
MLDAGDELRVPGTSRADGAGFGRVVAEAGPNGDTVLVAARAESPLRWVTPRFARASAAAACIVTFGGGLVDGDSIDIEVDVGAGATLLLFTQASTKVFRGSASQSLRANVLGTLVLLPDPVAAFAGARFRQRIDVVLGGEGSCVVLDGFTSGRPAFGERWAMERLDLRTTIQVGSDRLVTDALRFDVEDGALAERAGSFEAFATLIAVGERVRPVIEGIASAPLPPPDEQLVRAGSPLPRAAALGIPGAVSRIAASSPSRAEAAVRALLRNLPEIGVVDPWVARHA